MDGNRVLEGLEVRGCPVVWMRWMPSCLVSYPLAVSFGLHTESQKISSLRLEPNTIS